MKQKDEFKREAIINVTIDMVYTNGFAGVKMAQIAKKVDISPSTLYVYFKSKNDLISSIATDLLKKITQTSQNQMHSDLPFKLKFKAIWLFYVNFEINNRKEMSFINQVKQSPYYKMIPLEIRNLKSSLVLDLLDEGKRQGLIKNLDNSILAALLSAFLTETVKLIDSKTLQLNEAETNTMFLLAWDAIKN
ncbi:TetR/AcrR family transcriptional regulator [Formosa sediminum]|uniref:TetR/AcrR family transcriptional regulator n=1 Tax=Formosa sediminum TaxID=2594004 RepID=A0A516GTX4_9FLAO|nr:TetR/AcrR family transcriptional regulator [Formosa sediminum]QDO94967.1 TetR/AcrR family transcriptional regulator [Formosa sediminum]